MQAEGCSTSVTLKQNSNSSALVCKYCQKKLQNKGILERHLLVHTGEKPHACKLCNRCFNREDNLKIHMMTHSGEKPHKCEVCKKSFSLNRLLNEHMVTHTGDKTFYCETCNMSFTRKHTLKVHTSRQIHLEKIANNMRDSKFTQEQNMNQHMSGHLKKYDNLSSLSRGTVLETFKHGITGQLSSNRNCETEAQNLKQNASFQVTISSPMNSISLPSKNDNRNWNIDESPLDLSKTGRKHSCSEDRTNDDSQLHKI